MFPKATGTEPMMEEYEETNRRREENSYKDHSCLAHKEQVGIEHGSDNIYVKYECQRCEQPFHAHFVLGGHYDEETGESIK